MMTTLPTGTLGAILLTLYGGRICPPALLVPRNPQHGVVELHRAVAGAPHSAPHLAAQAGPRNGPGQRADLALDEPTHHAVARELRAYRGSHRVDPAGAEASTSRPRGVQR